MMRKINIAVLSGVSQGDVFHFEMEEGQGIIIGRLDECDLVLQDPTVSRRHVRIENIGGRLFISDLGSTQGTIHMGFQLARGPDGKRELARNDEFKIGEAIFRVTFKEDEVALPGKVSEKEKRICGPIQFRKIHFAYGALASVLVFLLIFLFWPVDNDDKFPIQRSGELMSLPREGLVGYLSEGGNAVDRSHLDKAQFALPPGDLVIEFDYRGESEVEVLIDDVHLDVLKPHIESWRKFVIFYRDVVAGAERKLAFDNLEYPPKGKGGSLKRWAVKDVRIRPVTREGATSFETKLADAAALSEVMNRNLDGITSVIRTAQAAVIEALRLAGMDAKVERLDLEEVHEDPVAFKRAFDTIRSSHSSLPSPGKELDAISKVAAELDAELWRRVNSNLRQVDAAVKMKQPIEAYDALMQIKGMFPAGDDLRWTIADKLLKDKKVVPPPMLKNPAKYRKHRE